MCANFLINIVQSYKITGGSCLKHNTVDGPLSLLPPSPGVLTAGCGPILQAEGGAQPDASGRRGGKEGSGRLCPLACTLPSSSVSTLCPLLSLLGGCHASRQEPAGLGQPGQQGPALLGEERGGREVVLERGSRRKHLRDGPPAPHAWARAAA